MGVKKKWGYRKIHQKKVGVKMKVGVKKSGAGNVGKEISLTRVGGHLKRQKPYFEIRSKFRTNENKGNFFIN